MCVCDGEVMRLDQSIKKANSTLGWQALATQRVPFESYQCDAIDSLLLLLFCHTFDLFIVCACVFEHEKVMAKAVRAMKCM